MTVAASSFLHSLLALTLLSHSTSTSNFPNTQLPACPAPLMPIN